MNIDSVQKAILSRDADAVVAAVATWDEEQRAAATGPLNVLMLSLGFERHVSLPCELNVDSPEVVAKRKADCITPMSQRDKTFDYEMHYIAWLSRYAVGSLHECQKFSSVPDHEERSAQIMADRKPPWWRNWYSHVTGEHQSMTGSFWSLLYQRKMVHDQDFAAIASTFGGQMPETFANFPVAVQQVLREIPAARDLIYDMPTSNYNLSYAKSWVTVIQWLIAEELLDKPRLLTACISALDRTTNQTERNGCLILIKALNADPKILATAQADWLRLVADNQAAVAGFAISQLQLLEKAKCIDAAKAIAVLPHAFRHAAKSHAVNAIKLLTRIASKKSLRCDATEAIAGGLLHPNKDVQAVVIEALQKHLQPTDDEALRIIAGSLDSISPTLRKQAEALIASKPSDKSTTPQTVKSAIDLDFLQARAAKLDRELCMRFRIDQAIAAAAEGRIDETCRWSIMDVKVLNQAVPIEPINTVEELVDATAAAVEYCDDPDSADRVLSGIARLCHQRTENFAALTKPLAERACAFIMSRPNRGIVGGFLGQRFSNLIGAWLGVEADEDSFLFRDPISGYLNEIEQRVRRGYASPLLSEATHQGGWIDPRVWVDRVLAVEESKIDFLESDLVRSLLRLMPDGRDDAWRRCETMSTKWKQLASLALGESVKLDDSWSAQVWFAAIRARDPWIDLSKLISDDELASLPELLLQLPDVVVPADYQWSVKPISKSASRRGLISASPSKSMHSTMQDFEDEHATLRAQFLSQALGAEDFAQLLEAVTNREKTQRESANFFTAQLHHLPLYPAPAYTYPYFAMQWPLKLDWYWCLATIGLSRRLESGGSVEERYSQFFLPLLENYRPLCPMAARALWIASVSKDTSARSMAVEVWIALIAEDRCDVETLIEALAEVVQGGWVKFSRVGELMGEVSRVSAQHAYLVASVIEGLLYQVDVPAKDIAKLVEPLNECCEQLGRSISESLRKNLTQISSGKAKATAKALCERKNHLTEFRMSAIVGDLSARIDRALASSL